MDEIFLKSFEYSKSAYGFSLSYQLRDMRHTIFAEKICGSEELIIDFVPAIKIVNEDYQTGWHAIPKLMPGSQANYSFMMSNTRYENSLMQDKDLQKALILTQVLCRAKGLNKIRYYHLMNLVISQKIDEYASEHTLQDVFIEVGLLYAHSMTNVIIIVSILSLQILRELYNAINDEHLPHMWNSSINLLSNLSPKDLTAYEIILDKAYDTLSTYPNQDKLSYDRCYDHFEY